MPRPLRVHIKGALYVVTSRAIEGALLFRDHRDAQTYLQLLVDYRSRYGCHVFAYALLPDTLHLCLELTNEATISMVMHALSSRYTKYYNKRYGHTGHLFQERFHAVIAEKAPSLIRLTGYLHTLAKRHGVLNEHFLNDPALVQEIREIRETLHREHPGITYEQYVEGISKTEEEQFSAMLQRSVLGSDVFVEHVRRQQQRRTSHTPSQPQPAPSRPLFTPTLTISMVLVGVLFLLTGRYVVNRSHIKETVATIGTQTGHQLTTAQLASFVPAPELQGSVWEVQVRGVTGVGGTVVQSDHLEFRQGKVHSQQLASRGFAPSNYTVQAQQDGTVIWETMQTAPSGEVVCWRGELRGEQMQGVLTRQFPGASAANFSFIGAAQPQHESVQPTSQI